MSRAPTEPGLGIVFEDRTNGGEYSPPQVPRVTQPSKRKPSWYKRPGIMVPVIATILVAMVSGAISAIWTAASMSQALESNYARDDRQDARLERMDIRWTRSLERIDRKVGKIYEFFAPGEGK